MAKFVSIVCSVLLAVFSSAQTYNIYAVKFGERKNQVRMADQALGYNGSDSTKVFFMYWVLKNKNNTILVDAGFTADVGIDTNAITFTRPDKLLASIQIAPGDVSDIIITHPHWDHLGGISLYPNAVVWMQEEDYNELTANRKNPESFGFNILDIEKLKERKAKGNLRLLKGLPDETILPNITVFKSGSQHTAGSQFVMANNTKQNVIIASDNCKYYRNITDMLSSPATSDRKAYIRNLGLMKHWAGGDADLVIPGHDPLVFTKFKKVAPNVVEITK